MAGERRRTTLSALSWMMRSCRVTSLSARLLTLAYCAQPVAYVVPRECWLGELPHHADFRLLRRTCAVGWLWPAACALTRPLAARLPALRATFVHVLRTAPDARDAAHVAGSYGPSSACTMPCTGNSAISCGGHLAVDVYVATDTVLDAPAPHNYTRLGCYK